MWFKRLVVFTWVVLRVASSWVELSQMASWVFERRKLWSVVR